MSKIENEIKILNIEVENMKSKLTSIGAKYLGQKHQKVYVYDIPTLYYRFLEIRCLLNSEERSIISTNLKKLEILFLELEDLLEEKALKNMKKNYGIKSLIEILTFDIKDIRKILLDEELNRVIDNQLINPNKWVRLRESNDKVELTVKHILKKEKNDIQKVIESEITVSSLEEANDILSNMGLSRRSYQEKIRYSYKYKGAEIEIDIWPLLDPYMEIETNDTSLMEELKQVLVLDKYEIVSLNTEELYNRKGIDVHSMSELKF